MDESGKKATEKRSYPAIYEKTIPILLAVIGIAVIVLLVIAFAVVLGVFPGS